MAVCRQLLGLVLAAIGFLGSIITCVFPAWKFTTFIGSNIFVAQTIWEGLWMNCVTLSTGQMRCKVYDSMLALPHDLQCARAFTVISIVFGFFGILLGIVGGKCTNCVRDERQRRKVTLASGIVFITGGIFVLIPVCWVANDIIADFKNPFLISAQKRELGMSLYIGWASAGLLLLGGGLLCCSCPPKDETECEVKYSKAHVSMPRYPALFCFMNVSPTVCSLHE